MINSRGFAISILSAILSTAPLICAQDAKPSATSVAIQELALQPTTSFGGVSFQADSIAASAQTPDLSRYRDFRVGMTLPAVAKYTDLGLSDITVLHERPALIQELNWSLPPTSDSTSVADPVESIVFTFYNGELFRMVVSYAAERTVGLSESDLIKVISATYGGAVRPAVKATVVSLSFTDATSDRVIARWETSQYSVSLVRSAGDSSFGVLLLSKAVNSKARIAAAEGGRIEEREAPQREIARLKQQDDDERAEQAKAKLANQAAFRL